MSLSDACGCPAGRPLGAPHLEGCSLATPGPTLPGQPPSPPVPPNVVSIYRNPETQRPVAVPDEIVSLAEREYRAWKAHTAGKSWQQVAIDESYDSPSAAQAAVKRYLDEAVAVVQDFTRENMIADHVGRLALMRSYVWKGVEAGKTASLAQALAIEDRWVRAFGLDQPDPEGATGQTVVVVESDSQYAQTLREIAEEAAREAQNDDPEASAG